MMTEYARMNARYCPCSGVKRGVAVVIDLPVAMRRCSGCGAHGKAIPAGGFREPLVVDEGGLTLVSRVIQSSS